ncbi:MAG: hypothetical protein M1820_003684 [Bogoriella megaspora]|nr:MAG: hypothetical protein M1820_003684 [Bogoriella megaspora]
MQCTTTSRYTDEEWILIVRDTEVRLNIPRQRFQYPGISKREFAKLFDHTLLKPEASPKQIDQLCSEARQWGFNSVNIRAFYARRAFLNLRGSSVRVSCTVGFHDPSDEQDLFRALKEANRAYTSGAKEICLLLSSPLLHTQHYDTIYAALAVLRSLCPSPVFLKLVISTQTLREADVVAACVLARAARFDTVEVGNVSFDGRTTIEASEYDVRLVKGGVQAAEEEEMDWRAMDERKRRVAPSTRQHQYHLHHHQRTHSNDSMVSEEESPGTSEANGSDDWGYGQTFISRAREASQRASALLVRRTASLTKPMGVKASGEIKSLGDAARMLEAGATRIGTSHTVEIMKEARERIEHVGDVDQWVKANLARDMGWRNSRLTRFGAGELEPGQLTRWYTER